MMNRTRQLAQQIDPFITELKTLIRWSSVKWTWKRLREIEFVVNFVEAMLEDAESEEETDCEYYENDASTEHANLAGAWDWDTHLCFLLLYLCVVWGLTEGRMMRSGEEGRWRRNRRFKLFLFYSDLVANQTRLVTYTLPSPSLPLPLSHCSPRKWDSCGLCPVGTWKEIFLSNEN